MEAIYQLFKSPGEYRFPFELLEHFDLESARELGDVASKQLFHEIVLREKQGEPTVYIRRSFRDNPLLGIPTVITIQRNLSFSAERGLTYCNNYGHRLAKLQVHPEVKQFLSDDYHKTDVKRRVVATGRQTA